MPLLVNQSVLCKFEVLKSVVTNPPIPPIPGTTERRQCNEGGKRKNLQSSNQTLLGSYRRNSERRISIDFVDF